MSVYTFHVSQKLPTQEALTQAVLVRDGFSWGAFFFSFLWFFWHRLWLAGFLVLLFVGTSQAIINTLPLNPLAASFAQLAIMVLIGLEASSLRRWTLQRRKFELKDIVQGDSVEEAELKSLSRFFHVQPSKSGTTAAKPYDQDVIGLFPKPEISL